jgi:hypothetical protein
MLVLAAVLGAAGVCSTVHGADPSAVGVIRSAPWSPGDASRDGAGEFSVLMQVAQLQRTSTRAGLLGVGAPRGVFAPGMERALRFAVLSGVAVVKLARDGDVAACPDELFVDGGGISEIDAQRLLAGALERHGPPPRAANPTQPTAGELAKIRSHVARLQQHFKAAQPTLLASR